MFLFFPVFRKKQGSRSVGAGPKRANKDGTLLHPFGGTLSDSIYSDLITPSTLFAKYSILPYARRAITGICNNMSVFTFYVNAC